MSKQLLYNAMTDYYKARAGSASETLFENIGQIAGLTAVYFNEQRKKAAKRFAEFDVSKIPSATSLWAPQAQKVLVNRLNDMNNKMGSFMKNPNKNAAEIMQLNNQYQELENNINKIVTFYGEAKENSGQYSAASNDNYINQIINKNYELYEDESGELMIKLLTDTPDGQLSPYEGTLDDFSDMIFLERKDLGDNVVGIINKIVKNDRAYEDGELQQALTDIVGNKKTLSSAFWDDIFHLTSGPFDSTTLAGQFAMESGYDADKMEEYRMSSSIFRNLKPEEQQARIDEMRMYVRGKVSLLATARWQNNLKPEKTGKGTGTTTLYFDGKPMETFSEKYKTVDVGRGSYNPRVVNNLLRKIESKYVEPGTDGISFKWGNDFYLYDGQNWRTSGRSGKKRKRWEVVGTDTQLLDSLGFGDYLGMSTGVSGTTRSTGGGEFDNMGFED